MRHSWLRFQWNILLTTQIVGAKWKDHTALVFIVTGDSLKLAPTWGKVKADLPGATLHFLYSQIVGLHRNVIKTRFRLQNGAWRKT